MPKASSELIEFIKLKEGFKPKAYPDKGQWSVGFGQKTTDPKAKVTLEQATSMLQKRVEQTENELRNGLTRDDFSQTQWDALVDAHYNRGDPAMQPMMKLVNERREDELRDMFINDGGLQDPGLIDRRKKRLSMWTGESTSWMDGKIAPTPKAATFATPEAPIGSPAAVPAVAPTSVVPTLESSMEEFEQQNDAIAQSMDAFEAEQTMTAQSLPDVEAGLNVAASAVDDVRVAKNKEAKKVAEELGIPLEEAQAFVELRPAKEVIAEKRHTTLKDHYPVTAELAQDPNNYAAIRDTGNYIPKVEVAARSLNKDKRGDWEKALDNNRVMLKEAYIRTAMTLGGISLKEGKKLLLEVDEERKANALEGDSAKKIAALMENGSFLDKMKGTFMEAEGYLQTALQSQGSTIAVMVAGGAGGIGGGMAMGPVGAMIGSAGASFATGHLLSFNEYMGKQLEPFRNKETGIIDMDAAYSDPARVKRWIKEADIYGLANGVGDAGFSLVGGKLAEGFVKFIMKAPAKTLATKAAVGLVKVGAKTALKAGEEGATETTALTAVKFYKGEESWEGFKEDVKEGVNEAWMAGATGGATIAIPSVGRGIKQVITTRKESTIRKNKAKADVNKANEAAAELAKVKNVQNENPEAAQENPDLVQEVIKRATQPKKTPIDPNAPMDANIDPLTADEIKQMEKEAVADRVSISPKEFLTYMTNKGFSPEALIQEFSPEVQQEFLRNKETDTSVSVPMSEWMRYTVEDPEIEMIVRVNGNELNALEANEIVDGLEKDPTVFNSEMDFDPNAEIENDPDAHGLSPEDSDYEAAEAEANQRRAERKEKAAAKKAGRKAKVTDIEGADAGGIEIIEPDSADGNIISRPIFLRGKYKTDMEKKLFHSLLSRLKKANDHGFDPEMVEFFAELQLRHMRNRAAMLGKPIEEIGRRLRIGKSSEAAGRRAHGSFTPNWDKDGKMIPDAPYTIVFAKTSNVKTVVHEFAHSWLHEMTEDWEVIEAIPETELTQAQADYKESMKLAADFFRLEKISDLYNGGGDEFMRSRHESFAQTAELYLLHGKFENNKVKALMEGLRKWVVKIAHTIGKTYTEATGYSKNYRGLETTPEIERMFEGILGATAKSEESVTSMFPDPAFDPAMLGTDGPRYMESIRLARSEAVANVYGKSFVTGIKDRENMIEQHHNKVYEEAAEIVEKKFSMQVLANFKSNYATWVNNKKIGEDPRFNYESVAKYLGLDEKTMAELKANVPREMISGKKKGGMDIAYFVDMYGIRNPAEALAFLTETGLREDMIAQEEKKIIDRDYPILKTDEEIHEAAVEAVNAYGKERILMDEVKILMKKLGDFKGLVGKLINPAEYIAKAAKPAMEAKAAENVLDANANGFSADKYLTESGRQGRMASRMYDANNFLEAFDAKHLQTVNFFAYKIAREAIKELANVRLRTKQFIQYSRSKDALKNYDADTMAYGRKVIQAVATMGEIPRFSRDGFSRHSGITQPHIDQINNAIDQYNKVSGGRKGAAASVAGHIQFGQLLKTIMKTAMAARSVELAGKTESIDDVIEDAVFEIQSSDTIVSHEKSDGWGASLRTEFVNVRSVFASFFPSAEAFATSTLGKLYYRIVEAEAERNLDYNQERDIMSAAVKEVVGNDKTLKGIVAPIFGKFGISINKGKQYYSDELKYNFRSKAEIWMAFLLMGSKSGAEKFLLGNRNDEGETLGYRDPETKELNMDKWNAFANRMMTDGTITEKDFKMFETIWAIFERLHPRVKDAMRQSDGFLMGHVAGWEVQTPWGMKKGGYVPVAARDQMTPGKVESLLDPDTLGYKAQNLYPSMNTGMTNQRDEVFYPVSLDMSRITMYLGSAMNIIHLRNPMMDFGKIIASKEVTTALEKYRPGFIGDEKEGVLVPWYNAVKGQTYTEYNAGAMHRFAKKLRHHSNIATYFANFASAGRNFLGILPAVTQVNPVRLASALVSTNAAPKKSREMIANKSTYMRNRLQNSQGDMVKSWDRLETNFNWMTWTDEKIETFTYFFIQTSQNITDVAVWTAAYEKGVMGLGEEAAVRYADGVVEATQGSPNVSAMSRAQRGDDFKKLISMVSSVPIAMHNMAQIELMRNQSTKNKVQALLSIAIMTTILPTVMEAAMVEGLFSSGEDEDEFEEDEDKQQRILKNIAIRTLGGSMDTVLPIASRWATSAIMFGKTSLSPGLNQLNKAPDAVRGLGNNMDGISMTKREVDAFTDLFTSITGIPLVIYGEANALIEGQKSEDQLEDEKMERSELLAERSYED